MIEEILLGGGVARKSSVNPPLEQGLLPSSAQTNCLIAGFEAELAVSWQMQEVHFLLLL